MNFSDFYSYEDFKKVSNCRWWRTNKYESYNRRDMPPLTDEEKVDQKRCREADNRDREFLSQHEETVYRPAIHKFLTALRDSGRLVPITGCKGRDINFVNDWNRFVEGGLGVFESYEIKHLFSEFDSPFLVDALVRVENKRELDPWADYPDELVQQMYKRLVSRITSGTLESHETIRDHYDAISGDRINLQMEEWKLSLVRFDSNLRDFVEVQDLDEPELQTVEIDIPTGQLLISDWFRIEGFNEATEAAYEDSGDNYSDYDDINSALGAINRSKKYAKGNIAHVQTTNTYCGIEQTPDGKLGIIERWSAEVNEDDMTEEQLEDENFDYRLDMPSDQVGQFSCDLWWITALDRSVLVEHLRQGGNKEPEKALDDYLKSNEAYSRNIVELNVKPGRWKIHFGAKQCHSGDGFMVNGKDYGFDERPKFWAVLEPIEV